MIYFRKLFILSGFSFLSICHLSARTQPSGSQTWSEYGIPVFHNYSSREYRAHFQNWAVIQDKQGLILVANNDGLLEYDGVNWQRYNLDGKLFHSLRSLAIDSTGIIYCGTGSQFGYLIPDERGILSFNSLRDRVTEKYPDFNDVWYTLIRHESVFFVTHSAIFRWDGKNVSVVDTARANTIFHTAFVVRDTLYIRQSDVGLLYLTPHGLELIPGGEEFARIPVYFMECRRC